MQRLDIRFRHPFSVWCTRNNVSEQAVCEFLTKRGIRCGSRYLRFIGNGNRPIVNVRLAQALSDFTNGEVSKLEIIDWKRPTSKKSKRAA